MTKDKGRQAIPPLFIYHAEIKQVAQGTIAVQDNSNENKDTPAPFKSGINPDYQGKRAECDGGAQIAETKYAGRQFFAGTLTGDYRDFGDYPWRWYLLANLSAKPEAYTQEAVWCDEGSLILMDN